VTAVLVGFRAGSEQRARSRVDNGVPWLTVLAFAAVLALADGFWTTSVRGAVGSISRAQGPFARWWHEAAVVLPAYAFAVLGAISLSRRLFTRARSSVMRTAGTAAVIVLAATLTGMIVLIADAAWDYHLQAGQIRMMTSMDGGTCGHRCVTDQLHATLALHVRAVIYVSRWVLLTNTGLVVWMIALLGGRLALARGIGSRRGALAGRCADARIVLAGVLAGSAAVHAAVIGEHLAEWPAAGEFFIGLTGAELAAAALVLVRPRAWTYALTALLAAGPLFVWTYSRFVGLPIGPEPGQKEPVGLPDAAASMLELVTLALAVALFASVHSWRRRPLTPAARGLVLAAVALVTAIGVAATGSTSFDLFVAPNGHSATAHDGGE